MTCRHWNRWELVDTEGKRLALWCPGCGGIKFNWRHWEKPEAVGGKPSTDDLPRKVVRHGGGA